MLTKQAPAKAMQDEITVSVRELLISGAALGEVMVILREYIFAPKGIILIKDQSGVWMVMKFQQGKLFTHPSLAACVEFALRYEVTP